MKKLILLLVVLFVLVNQTRAGTWSNVESQIVNTRDLVVFGTANISTGGSYIAGITVTNVNNLTNQSLNINGITLSWSTNAAAILTALQVKITNSTEQAATNIYTKLPGAGLSNILLGSISFSIATNTVNLTGLNNTIIAGTNTGAWGYWRITTNAATVAALVTTNDTGALSNAIATAFTSAINSTNNTLSNAVAAAWVAADGAVSNTLNGALVNASNTLYTTANNASNTLADLVLNTSNTLYTTANNASNTLAGYVSSTSNALGVVIDLARTNAIATNKVAAASDADRTYYATNAGYADLSGWSTNAGSATFAVSTPYATNAGFSTTGNYATGSLIAASSVYSTNAGSAVVATTAGTSTNVLNVGITNGLTVGQLTYYNGTGFVAVPKLTWNGSTSTLGYDGTTNFASVLLSLRNTGFPMNVGFRINSSNDVPANFVTYGFDTASIAVSVNPTGTAYSVGNPFLNMYFGIATVTNNTGFMCLNDGAGSNYTIWVGSDGFHTNWNKIRIGPLAVSGLLIANVVNTTNIYTGSAISTWYLIPSFTGYSGSSGYSSNDLLTANGGNGDATFTVMSVDEDGIILNLLMTTAGSGYGANRDYVLTGGDGSGAMIHVDYVTGKGTLGIDANLTILGSLTASNATIGGGTLSNATLTVSNAVFSAIHINGNAISNVSYMLIGTGGPTGQYSFAQGTAAYAVGNYSFASGNSVEADGLASIAAGAWAVASNDYSLTWNDGVLQPYFGHGTRTFSIRATGGIWLEGGPVYAATNAAPFTISNMTVTVNVPFTNWNQRTRFRAKAGYTSALAANAIMDFVNVTGNYTNTFSVGGVAAVMTNDTLDILASPNDVLMVTNRSEAGAGATLIGVRGTGM